MLNRYAILLSDYPLFGESRAGGFSFRIAAMACGERSVKSWRCPASRSLSRRPATDLDLRAA